MIDIFRKLSHGNIQIKNGNVKPKRMPWNDKSKTLSSPLERWDFLFLGRQVKTYTRPGWCRRAGARGKENEFNPMIAESAVAVEILARNKIKGISTRTQ